jgi:hypothetical protein
MMGQIIELVDGPIMKLLLDLGSDQTELLGFSFVSNSSVTDEEWAAFVKTRATEKKELPEKGFSLIKARELQDARIQAFVDVFSTIDLFI